MSAEPDDEDPNAKEHTMSTATTSAEPGDVDAASCCGPAMTDATRQCPCQSIMKGRRALALGVCAVIVLAFLISQVGGVLGAIAFFRTF